MRYQAREVNGMWCVIDTITSRKVGRYLYAEYAIFQANRLNKIG